MWFKQKTDYEMGISDWSSDVCSSDRERDPDDHRQAQRAEPAVTIDHARDQARGEPHYRDRKNQPEDEDRGMIARRARDPENIVEAHADRKSTRLNSSH